MRHLVAAIRGTLLLAVLAAASAAGTPVRAEPKGPVCEMPLAAAPTVADRLPRTGAALRGGQPLTVLVMGGGTDWQAAGGFVSHLEHALEAALPGRAVHVQGLGAPGQLAKEAADRLRRTVAAEEPPVLVVWRTGVGDALAMTDPEKLTTILRKVAEWLAAQAVDLVLVDPAWHVGSPQEETYRRYTEAIAEAGRQGAVPVFPRYAIMRAWTSPMAAAAEQDKDACLARLLAGTILRAAEERPAAGR